MKGIFLPLVFFLPFVCLSQATLSADKTEIKIGDQIKATILINLSEGNSLLNQYVAELQIFHHCPWSYRSKE